MNQRSFILLLCFVVIAAVSVLAAGLQDVRFEPGRSYAAVQQRQASSPPPAFQMPAESPLWKVLLLWLAFVVNVAIFFFILPPELRKRIARQLISFVIGVLVLLLALRYKVLQLPDLPIDSVNAPEVGLDQAASGANTPVFQPPQVAPWTTYLISLGGLWIILVLLWLGYRRWRSSMRQQDASLDVIAEIARSSLGDLAAGRAWRDVVIETYARMSEAVSARRGLHRGAAMTAREFAEHLRGAGLPSEDVATLTRLFEGVRYGGRASSHDERREASACLESILRACGARA